LEAKQNEEKVKEHLIAEEIEKLVDATENVKENVEVDSTTLRQNDNQNDPDNKLEPRSNKESLESQPTESTQGTHRTTSTPRSPNSDMDKGESSVQKKSTIIRLHLPPRRSTRLTPPIPVPTTDEADDIILQDTIQLSLAE
nr:hypothetical protein [Tanacetum cinerariifolium]